MPEFLRNLYAQEFPSVRKISSSNVNGGIHASYDLVVRVVYLTAFPLAFMGDTTTLVHSKAIRTARRDKGSPSAEICTSAQIQEGILARDDGFRWKNRIRMLKTTDVGHWSWVTWVLDSDPYQLR